MRPSKRNSKTPNHRLVHYRPLGSADAELIAQLQHRLFPPELTEPVAEIRDILLNAEQHMVCNLSFGLFDDTRLVGYMFVYVETESLYYRRTEDVLYIKEIALLPGFESCLRKLFFKLYEQWRAFTPGMPLEAHAVEESLKNWRRMRRGLEYFGLTMTDLAEVPRPGRAPYHLLRLDVSDHIPALYEQAKPLPSVKCTSSKRINVVALTDPRQWLSLKDSWDVLLRDTEDSNVFQMFDYLWQWWKHFGAWNDLYVVVIRDGESVIGVVPLMREYFVVFGRTVRKLLFMTAPMEMSRPKLIFSRNSDLCWPAFIEFMHAHADEWDILDIDEQLPDSELQNVHKLISGKGWLIADSETICPYIDLTGTWNEFLSGLSRKMRSNINRMRRRLAEAGDIDVQCVNHWPALDATMETHCEIEAHSWKAERSLDLASDKSHYYFYRSLARAFGADGSFVQRILRCRGVPIASTFGITNEGVFQSLKIAHNRGWDRFSPGTVLESFELEALFAGNLRVYEFMGSFLTNKQRWTSTAHRTVNIHIYQRQFRLVLFYFAYFVLKRRIARFLKRIGQFDRADRLLKKFRANPFPRY